jgi:hypothetical protein
LQNIAPINQCTQVHCTKPVAGFNCRGGTAEKINGGDVLCTIFGRSPGKIGKNTFFYTVNNILFVLYFKETYKINFLANFPKQKQSKTK